jgi:hypothetical protein
MSSVATFNFFYGALGEGRLNFFLLYPFVSKEQDGATRKYFECTYSCVCKKGVSVWPLVCALYFRFGRAMF